MASPLFSFFTGRQARRALETIIPQRTFADVVLPPQTRRTLDHALAEVRNHALIFGRWGLGERHDTGLGLAFNFAGPPGTGKTICAEAIAHTLGKKLMVVNYAEAESMWVGETPKNIAAAFRSAIESVLAAKSVMQQTLYAPTMQGPERLDEADTPWQRAFYIALALGGASFVTALVAIAIAIAR